MPTKIAFLGAGRLATAIVNGLLARQVYQVDEIACTSRGGESATRLANLTGIKVELNLEALLGAADCVVLAFKPQSLKDLDPRVSELTEGRLVISLVAGKRLERLTKSFPKARNIVRTMPNTPCAVGAGITAFCARTPLSTDDARTIQDFLGALGSYVIIEESHMDAATAISGSGPGFAFELLSAFQAAAEALGLPREVAHKLATETFVGSGKLLATSNLSAEALRDQVVSPKGTTHAGLEVLAARQIRRTIQDAVMASAKRAAELSSD